jgi:hypothetical protein
MKGSFATRVSGSSDLYRVSITTYNTFMVAIFMGFTPIQIPTL